VPVLVLFVFFVLVIIIVGRVSWQRRVLAPTLSSGDIVIRDN
jgi:hypothetical protein